MAFRFPFDTILRFRQSVARQEELRLHHANEEVERVRSAIARLDTYSGDRAAALVREMLQSLSGAELRFAQVCAESLTMGRKNLQRELERREQERDRQIRVLCEARVAHETLKSLRDRQLRSYRIDSRRDEQRRIDEIFLLSQKRPIRD